MGTPSLPILHFVSLRGLGGVERCFSAFLREGSEVDSRHGTIDFHGVHPFIRETLGSLTIHDRKRLGPLKLPPLGALRRANLRRIVRSYGDGIALHWNRIGKVEEARLAKSCGLETVHWEQGWAWSDIDPHDAAEYLENMDRLCANSHASRRILELRYGCSGEIALAPIAMPIPSSLPPERSAPGSRPLMLGCCSRLLPFKGVNLALRSLAKLRELGVEAELHVAGDGPARPMLEALARDLGIEAHCRFLGEIDDTDAFYDGIDLLVHLSLRESAGRVSLEAQLRGCPVIASRVDGLPEYVRENEGGRLVRQTRPLDDFPEIAKLDRKQVSEVYDPDEDRLRGALCADPAAVAELVLAYRDDPKRYEEDARRGPERVRRDFDLGRISNDLLRWLASL